MNDADRDYFAFVRKAVCAHTWLQASMRRDLPSGDPRGERMRPMIERAEACVSMLAHALGDTDPFLPQPSLAAWIGGDSELPDRWLWLGLSALLLEIILGHVDTASSAESLREAGASFGLERRFALAEAGRLTKGKDDACVATALAEFVPPGETAWGEAFVAEAAGVLMGRVGSRREILRTAAKAIREVPQLPGDLWSYVEPHLSRHAELFELTGMRGKIRKASAYAVLKLI